MTSSDDENDVSKWPWWKIAGVIVGSIIAGLYIVYKMAEAAAGGALR